MSIGDPVATKFDVFGDGAELKDGPVPAVDPGDLRSVWVMHNDLQALAPGEQLAIGPDSFDRACSPEADVRAVLIRASILRKLKLTSESGGLISPWLHHGEPDDAVFKVVASFPMIRMQPGVGRGGLPFDVEELIKQIRQEARQHARHL